MSQESDFDEAIKQEFLNEVSLLLDQCEESHLRLEIPSRRVTELGVIFRAVHSMKAAGALVGFNDLSAFAHEVEDCLSLLRAQPDLVDAEVISVLLKSGDALRKRVAQLRAKDHAPWKNEELRELIKLTSQRISAGWRPESHPTPILKQTRLQIAGQEKYLESMSPLTVRVDWLQVEKISQIATDLLVLGKQLAAHTQDHLSDERFISFVSLLDKKVNLIFATSLRLKKISLSSLFLKSQRMIRDLSLHLGKPVHFTYSGEMLEVDRLVAEVLSETLIHILRNALDHGIESEEVRMQLGKPKKGLIQLSASQTQQEVIIQISDDGAGLSREKILGRAIQDGLLSNETGGVHSDRLSDSEVFELILAPGFSTAEKVTDVSGRGVGLDVVKTNLNQLRATLKIETQLGAGTRFTITLPLGAAKPYSSESKAA